MPSHNESHIAEPEWNGVCLLRENNGINSHRPEPVVLSSFQTRWNETRPCAVVIRGAMRLEESRGLLEGRYCARRVISVAMGSHSERGSSEAW